jgi:hypothetical protein
MYFVDLLLELLPSVPRDSQCAKYFKLLNDLLVKADPSKRSTHFYHSLFDLVIKLVREHPSLEVTAIVRKSNQPLDI